ncbi:hypothetical protein [Pedobacter sandarakinus]|uniref:hypothetical protein n=1 Tax=Pedobacter sandarakinus TaxID=353156 RepID=UPI0022465CFC|nr:hypothetical protein [Pedobacter sandarakinus]MCX2575902.1 hypothetical protein [Pedobacter sandarakinus]
MKYFYPIVLAALFVCIIIISTLQDASARQDPGIPCDPDAILGVDPNACPIDDYVPLLLAGGVGLMVLAQKRSGLAKAS